MNKKILLFLLLIILFILLGLNTDFSSKSTSDKIINQKFGPEESSIINNSSLANIKIIDLEKSNENYLTYKRHSEKDLLIPKIDNITGIRGFDRNSVRKTEFFFGGETLYAINHDLAKGCGLGDIKCSRQTLYYIDNDNQAKPVFVAEKGLGTIDNILGASYVYSTSINGYVFDYKYYIDMRGNLFIPFDGYVYLFKSGLPVGRLGNKKYIQDPLMFSDESNTYIDFRIQKRETLEIIDDVYLVKI